MDVKLSIGLAVTLAAQISAAVWYVAQTDATIKDLTSTVAELSSTMAIEESVNLKRDVDANATNITNIDSDVKTLGNHLAIGIGDRNDVLRRISILETEVKFIQKELVRKYLCGFLCYLYVVV